ncbi:sll0787 family AIR synthase-like protein [Marinobacter caseinilyticus]|uniref:sll0787 family AIR synthase-like protein n=1 Tax=Marinobacter caseinilyticus TaxID=2692195 RepID=UPI00140C27BE|nr:sll0787 family AIR synthase-like protein [Marinobacter caseinilyticus]
MKSLALRSSGGGWATNRQSELDALCDQLRALPEIAAKRSIQWAAGSRGQREGLSLTQRYAMPGDDCAAFKTGDGYQLLAMEGMLPAFVQHDPKAAGWSSVMVNVSDIAAMGGRAMAIVNAYWHNNHADSRVLLHHMKRACDVFGVAFAGGHSSIQTGYTPGLAVAITGHASHLLSCYHLKAGHRLFMLSDLTGSWHGDLPYWGCTQGKSPEQIRAQWEVPAVLAEEGLAVAAKDISNGGVLGTLIMMLELTGCGASLDLSAIPRPRGELMRWLRAFQSYGFLLVVEPDKVPSLIRYFQRSHLTCQPVGSVTDDGKIRLDHAGDEAEFWDIRDQPLTHMGAV